MVKRFVECDLSDPELNRKPKDGYGFIYMYTFRNGMKYVGQTIQTIRKRTYGHRHKNCKVDDVIKSGAKFEVDILSEVELEYLDDAERYCISKFNTLYPNGYNLLTGGQDTRTYLKPVRDAMSRSLKEYYTDPDNKKKLENQLGKARRIMQKKVICLETKKVYDSVNEAARDVNLIGSSTISKCIKGSKNTAGGYHWINYTKSYLDNADEILLCLISYEDEKKNILRRESTKRIVSYSLKANKWYKIRCIETDTIYNSIPEASSYMGIDPTLIHKVVVGKYKATHGYHFEKVV